MVEPDFSTFSNDELTEMYHKINAELTREFLNRVPWEEQEARINKLIKISAELSERKKEVDMPTRCSARNI